MLDTMKCTKLLPVQNKYPATRFICVNYRIIGNQKVQVADEIERDIWENLLSSDVADDA